MGSGASKDGDSKAPTSRQTPRFPKSSEEDGLGNVRGELKKGGDGSPMAASLLRASSPLHHGLASPLMRASSKKILGSKSSNPRVLTKVWRVEVMRMAEALGINPVEEEEVMWIAEKAVDAPVKPPWAKFMDADDGSFYYYNAETKVSQWRHPFEQEWRNLVREERQKQVVLDSTLDGGGGEESSGAVVYQREPTFVMDDSRYAVLIPSLRGRCKQYNHLNPAPNEWGLIKVMRAGKSVSGPAEKVRSWYHADVRLCQVPYLSAIWSMYDKLPEHDPRSTEGSGLATADALHFNGETIVSLDLSLNNITSLKSGSLGAFVHLRSLNLSQNCLNSTEGIGAATGLKTLDLSNNRLKTPADLRGDTALVASSPGLVALKGLTSLNLDHNVLFNIKPVLRLTTLTSLSICSNQFKNLWGIETLTNLETLKARDNELEEMTGSIVIQLPGEEKCERIKLQSSLTSLDLGSNKIPTMDLIIDSLHPDCDLVALNFRGNLLRDNISNRYTLLDRFEHLAMLDGQEVKPAMRRQLAEMHRLEQVKGIAQAVKDSYLERLERERQRKDWGVDTLKSQQKNLEELFMQMQAKMEAEVMRSTNQMLITGKQRMSIAMVVRAKKLAADLRERHERDALAFAERVPKASAVVGAEGAAGQLGTALINAINLGQKDKEEIRRQQLKVKVKAVMAAQRVANMSIFRASPSPGLESVSTKGSVSVKTG